MPSAKASSSATAMKFEMVTCSVGTAIARMLTGMVPSTDVAASRAVVRVALPPEKSTSMAMFPLDAVMAPKVAVEDAPVRASRLESVIAVFKVEPAAENSRIPFPLITTLSIPIILLKSKSANSPANSRTAVPVMPCASNTPSMLAPSCMMTVCVPAPPLPPPLMQTAHTGLSLVTLPLITISASPLPSFATIIPPPKPVTSPFAVSMTSPVASLCV